MIHPFNDEHQQGRSFSWRERLPETIADHEIIRRIGQGSYGGVWLARNKLTGTYRAVKIIWREAFDHARPFEREFEAIKRFEPISLSYPGFVNILQVGALEDAFYYIMELGDDEVRGTTVDPAVYRPRTLSRHRVRRLPLEDCVQIGISLSESLQVLHEAKLLHRDIKPSNVIFVNGKAKLADIGLISTFDEAKSMVGTAGFVPPEGPTSPQADIFSLGKLLYEISTGKDRLEFPELPDDVSAENTLLLEINQIVLKACANEPQKRYKNAAQIREELELLQGGRSIKRLRKAEQRLRRVSFVLVFGALLAVAGFWLFDRFRRLEQAEAEQRQRRIGSLLAQGTVHMEDGDYAAALPYFIQAARDEGNPSATHRLRLGAVAAAMYRPVSIWSNGISRLFIPEDGPAAYASTEGRTDLLDAESGKPLSSIPFGGGNFVASSDGRILADASSNILVRATLDAVSNPVREVFPEEIQMLRMNAAGSQLAILDGSGRVTVRSDVSTNVFEHPAQVLEMRLSASGKYLTCASMDGSACVHDLEDGQTIAFPRRHDSYAYDALLIRDESVLVTSGFDRVARAWDLKTHQQIGLDMPHDDGVVYCEISPDGQVLATAGLDGTARLWDAKTFRPLPANHILYLPFRARALAFLGNSRLLTHCANGVNVVWNLTGAPRPEIDTSKRAIIPNTVAISEPGIELRASGKLVSGRVQGRSIRVAMPENVTAIAFSPDRQRFAVACAEQLVEPCYAALFLADGSPTGVRLRHRDGVTFAAFSNSGEKVVTCGEDFVALLWDPGTGQQLTPPLRHTGQALYAAFNQDDTWVAVATARGTVRLWDARTGEPISPPFAIQERLLNYVFFTENDTTLICGNEANEYRHPLPFFQGLPDGLYALLPSPALRESTAWIGR